MKNILVIGATGQIGSELILRLREVYGEKQVVAGYFAPPFPENFFEQGPTVKIDATKIDQIASAVKEYNIDTIYNLAAILSVVGEQYPKLAWNVGMGALMNCLDVAKEYHCGVFTPSSIGSFGNGTPLDATPQDTIQRPNTIYGITKVAGELLSDYYMQRYGVDARSVRFPGLISNVTLPGGGTTDYAVEMYYAALKGERYVCPIKAGTYLDMMYMPDALDASIKLMEADTVRLIHHNSFNITAMSLDPETIRIAIQKHIPGFDVEYAVDPLKQCIAESWPNSMDDHCARDEWDWNPVFDIDSMTQDMIKKLSEKKMHGLL